MDKDNKEIERNDAIHVIAERVYNNAIEELSKGDFGPIDLVACFAICIVNANHTYSKKGEEREAFEHLLNGLCVLFEDIENQAKINEAMVEKIIADIEGQIQ